ncbi:GNAT family N-acetyltransferase [Desulfosediminicola flagellatus]|uniref:GNAT family N-acetyltransferase n=1 Tax=Desulfosediminicola flagellatus TaxID=2569541 RepID=UPI0010AC89C8|nr:GNAT family N-acetyltransferase [Desulfosediminicola flagellatus]
MNLITTYDCTDIDWQTISETLKSVGMAYYEPEKHKKAFQASHTTVFVYDAKTLIGFGRAISDGAYQAAVYDCAVVKEYQGRGIGRIIVEKILEKIADCNVILYAAPGKEGFYEKQGFRKMKTGMALFNNSDSMKDRGFTE